MNSKFLRVLAIATFVTPGLAVAQATTPASSDPLPAAPGAPTTVATGTGTKVGTISVEQAIFASNEGQRDFEALSKKLEPKQTELKGQNDEIDSLKKQLNTQDGKLNDEARANLVKQIEEKQKKLERDVQDARDDAQNQQNEIAQRILQKMAPIIVKYAGDNGFGLIIDTSNPWPNGPVLWAGTSVDITKPVVDTYNVQSGVPAPAHTTTPAAGTKPSATGATRSTTTPAASKPQPK